MRLAAYTSMVEFKANFREVHLLKGYRLGIGTYGAVFKAKCDSLICAAKVLHPTLFNPTMQHQIAAERSHVGPIRKFEQECEFLSTGHANQQLAMMQWLNKCKQNLEDNFKILISS